jgi:hypothetical protein
MGQPRPDDESLSEPEWLARFAAEYRKLTHTPPLQMQLPIDEAHQLALEAARAKQEAIAQGRATPRPAPPPPRSEEKTTCLHAARAPESSAPSSSKESTEEELTAGELSSLAQMAADDREILERKRLQKATPLTKPRT